MNLDNIEAAGGGPRPEPGERRAARPCIIFVFYEGFPFTCDFSFRGISPCKGFSLIHHLFSSPEHE